MRKTLLVLLLVILTISIVLSVIGCGESPNDPQVCPQCGGTGFMVVVKSVSQGYEMYRERCDYCFGTGTVAREKADRYGK